MSFEIKSFKPSNKTLIEKAFQIRNTVFVQEQNVPENMEYDGLDKEAIHFLIFNKEKAVGTSRYRKTKKGYKLERFAILETYRNQGFASKLLKHMLKNIEPEKEIIYLFAQINAVKFYEKHNFTIIGDKFMEAGIVHYEMEYK